MENNNKLQCWSSRWCHIYSDAEDSKVRTNLEFHSNRIKYPQNV